MCFVCFFGKELVKLRIQDFVYGDEEDVTNERIGKKIENSAAVSIDHSLGQTGVKTKNKRHFVMPCYRRKKKTKKIYFDSLNHQK